MPVRVRWWVAVEAAVYLLGARLALRLFSFQRLTFLFSRRAQPPELAGAARQQTRQEVQRAIWYVRRWAWMPTTCLHRAMAAQAMLLRRGVSTVLYYGAVTLPGRGLSAHAWVQDGGVGVVGYKTANYDGYHVLACYPKPPDTEPNNTPFTING